MKKFLAIIVLAALAGAGFYLYKKKAEPDNEGYVVEKVKTGDITSSVSATGKLKPKVSVLVGTEVSGTIREIFVDYNSPVRKGQVLVRLDQDLFQAQVDQAAAGLKKAEAGLKELASGRGMQRSGVRTAIEQKDAAAERAAAELTRRESLFEKGMISREELDSAREAARVAKAQSEQAHVETAKDEVTDAQVESADAAVMQAKAQLRTARTNLGKTVIRAPMDGVVVNKNVEIGQTVAASFQTPNLLDIGDLSVMQVEVSIDEADVGQTAVGQTAEFTVDAFPGKVFEGRLAKIYYAPVTVQNVVTYSGIVEVDNPEGLLRPGMTANVNVITNRKNDVLMVPNAALRVKVERARKDRSRPAPGEKTVWVMKGKEPEPVSIRTGITDLTNTEVVSGLKEGDPVVVEVPVKKDGQMNGRGGAGGSRPGGRMRMGI